MRWPRGADWLPNALRKAPRLSGRALIKLYKYTLSPWVGFHCRHLPTCSQYADEAIDRFGLWAGGWMLAARLARCHPFGTSGLDLVPQRLDKQCRWYQPWRYGRWFGTNTIAERDTAAIKVGERHSRQT